ncbi:hypothetical protein AKJ40_04305 [candidate division MSBL1 archaeon SCGC-AAA259M10]|nr:hypothetical protein AKJ62_04455 [candidate division MSBL1 archaeon SCGC-AAA259D14]KXA89124.1 hypothetical protein AKJ57_05815 [candidate division MSBL1 archaeon SCGC-AAA259A05]KXA98918.1 hypothetical protein AKJ40_04305 [candidate division MSBL1 archaeon SCGC-AAA259M10]KXA99366.1 hypothetical protein AKJ41_05555 [candidate division MSBL1 archaeon SCGC-AAA259O05]
MVWQTVVGKKEKNGLIFLKLKSRSGNIYPVQVAPGVDVPDHKGLMFADVLPESWVVREVKTKEEFKNLKSFDLEDK